MPTQFIQGFLVACCVGLIASIAACVIFVRLFLRRK